MKAEVLVQESKPMIESVRAFLASQGLIGNGSRKRGGWVLTAFEGELRELGAGGASLNQMLDYLKVTHGVFSYKGFLSTWLRRHGIGSSGRVVAKSEPGVEHVDV